MKMKKYFQSLLGICLLLAVFALTGCKTADTEPDYTKEQIAEIAKEKLEAFVKMYDSCFTTSLAAEGSYTDEDFVTINEKGGYLPVSRFASVEEAKKSLYAVCTQEFAKELYDKHWELDGKYPVLAELDGKLYAQPYDGVTYPEKYEILLTTLNQEGEILVVYRFETEEGEVWEEGMLRLVRENDDWYVAEQKKW